MEREKLGGRLGFILLSAGCAIGMGNVWKFPYITGQNGGGAFVLIYLFFLLVIGLPVLMIEFSLGRASRKSVARMYHELEPQGTRWHLHGWLAMAGNYLLMMFYTTVTGWMLYYCGSTARGKFMGLDPAGISGEFGKLCSDPFTMAVYMIAVVALGFFICSFSLSGGLERVTKYMMLALLGIMVMLAVNSVMMKGAGEGLAFYLKPDFSKINGSVIVSAINQAFFTLSLGIGSMAIFGSYLDKTHSLLGESVNVIVLDTFAAIVSGLIIFPACFTYGVSPNSGPSLIFETLPNIFNHMPLGRLWGMLFFVFMSFAALSTVLAVFENIISCCRDLTGWSRGKACLVNSVVLSLLSMPCVLGFNCWSRVKIAGLDIMGMEDFLVSNCLLPLGALIFVLFVTWRNGWGWKNFMAEANTGRGWKVQNWMRGYITYILPLIIFSLLVMGIISVFK
ncbi:MAG: sodium-dependent transporter [Verrucomicrobia bacterium]|nr:sodium-dependent transporter [Verrucomicrobiota bacterium]MBR5977777.1 sodium-dependent transporter [Verrucomicrobiota bacterium]